MKKYPRTTILFILKTFRYKKLSSTINTNFERTYKYNTREINNGNWKLILNLVPY